MSTRVLPSPAPNPNPTRLTVGIPISAGSAGQRWNNDLLLLLAASAQPIAACSVQRDEAAPSYDVVFSYTRSPGCQILVVSIELHPNEGFVSDEYGTSTVEVLVNGTTATFVGPTGGLAGDAPVQVPPRGQQRARAIRAFIDVSGLTVGTAATITVQWTNTSGDASGLAMVNLGECPLPAVNPVVAPTTEVGMDGAWPAGDGGPTHALHDGDDSRPSGFVRLIDQLDKARYQVRRHWQLSTPQHENYFIYTTSTVSGALNWRIGGSISVATQDPVFILRPRRLYATDTFNAYAVRIWYKTTSGVVGHGGEITFHTDNGVTAPADTTVTLAASTSWALATSTLYIPLDADVCTLRIRGKINFAEVLAVSHIALIEDES